MRAPRARFTLLVHVLTGEGVSLRHQQMTLQQPWVSWRGSAGEASPETKPGRFQSESPRC